ncbi:MAG: uncharacterized small protein (DUF1192 family) [Paracoccaceae bacterium]|jgi:uncharacterized small protein (DUF1192 family)
MNDMHTPTPEFTRFLEWQTRTTLRRSERFDAAAPLTAEESRAPELRAVARLPWPGISRAARIAAIILVSMMAGAAGVVAAEQVRESKVVERLLNAQTIRITLVEKKLEVAAATLAREQSLVDLGYASSWSVMPLQENQLRLKEDLARLRVDSGEVRASGREPDTAIDAPVVAGRDFEGERIELSLGTLRRLLKVANGRFELVEKRVKSGFAPISAAADEKVELDLLQHEVERLEAKLKLRHAFVNGEHARSTVVRLGHLLDASSRGLKLEVERAHISGRLEIAELRYREGFGPNVSDAIRVEIARLDAELALNALERSLYEVE